MTRPFKNDFPTVSSVDTRCRLEVASELVQELSTLTLAGQRYTMAKIVGVLSVPTVGPWMDDLNQQSARLAPDMDVFSRRAMDIVALLRASIDPLGD
jgi:hypothetical protein